MVLEPFSDEELLTILRRAISDKKKGLGELSVQARPDAMEYIVWAAEGDARTALNDLEAAASLVQEKDVVGRTITRAVAESALQKKALQYDKDGEEHYNLISAFHKSLRGSDPDAALYWLGRMLAGGEDPLYVARRMVRFASEDIGNADPRALSVAVSAMQAFQFVGLPEGDLALAQAAVYLATAPKSNALYGGYGKVKESIGETGTLPVPLHIRNAPTRLMDELGYGKDYKYAHDFEDAFVSQEYLPEALRNNVYYEPSNRGYEKTIRERLVKWRKLKASMVRDKKKKGR
jgi:putative ATPase